MLPEWIPLADYSIKYKVSVSTLRRKIKTDDINFKFDDGKYLILDEPVGTHHRDHRPSLSSEESLVGASSTPQKVDLDQSDIVKKNFPNGRVEMAYSKAKEIADKTPDIKSHSGPQNKEEPILAEANKLLVELKRAYSQILQEKEEQMLHLKEEVTDLKTLVKVLESENQRLKGKLSDRS